MTKTPDIECPKCDAGYGSILIDVDMLESPDALGVFRCLKCKAEFSELEFPELMAEEDEPEARPVRRGWPQSADRAPNMQLREGEDFDSATNADYDLGDL